MKLSTKKSVAIAAICLTLVLNLQYSFSHYIIGTKAMGEQAQAARLSDEESDTESSGTKPKYYVGVDDLCYRVCFHDHPYPFPTTSTTNTGGVTTCKTTSDTTSTCTAVACNAAACTYPSYE